MSEAQRRKLGTPATLNQPTVLCTGALARRSMWPKALESGAFDDHTPAQRRWLLDDAVVLANPAVPPSDDPCNVESRCGVLAPVVSHPLPTSRRTEEHWRE